MLLIVNYITTHISNALKIKQIILDYIDIFYFYVLYDLMIMKDVLGEH